jgi:hypothetical protein
MENAEFVIETHYGITYKTDNPVPIPDIITSLAALERVIHRAPRLIKAAYKDVNFDEMQVLVSSITSGSLLEDLLIRFIFKDEESYNKALESLGGIAKDNPVLKQIVGAAVGGFIAFGIMSQIGSEEPPAHIEAYNNTVINLGAEMNLSADNFLAVLKSNYR